MLEPNLAQSTFPCGFCGKTYSIMEAYRKEAVPVRLDTFEHLLICPHCQKALHLYFSDQDTDEAWKQMEERRKLADARTRSGVFRLKRAREMYAKVFEGVNKQLRTEWGVDRTHPYFGREQPSVEQRERANPQSVN